MPRFRRRPAGLLVMLLVVAAAAIVLRLLPAPPPISGYGVVVDGDTLRLDGERLRILGIDAPELDQHCTDPTGAEWACGRAARSRMEMLLRAGPATCQPEGRDVYDRTLAVCTVGTIDVGQAMVRDGLAVSDGRYFADAAAAQAEKAGIWAGAFTPPEAWRREHGVGRAPGGPAFMATVRPWFR